MKDANSRVEIFRGDITKLDVDAIVNAATRRFLAEAEWMARFIARRGPN
jgi:O-acetyl-ADP-ribose deacetylase (regulator of RNase III)